MRKADDFFTELARLRAEDPAIGIQWGVPEIYHHLIEVFAETLSEKGYSHLLRQTAALTAMSCQMAVWEILQQHHSLPFTAITAVDLATGSRLYFGDLVDVFLFGQENAVLTAVLEAYSQLRGEDKAPLDTDALAKWSIAQLTASDYQVWGQAAPVQLAPSVRHLWDYLAADLRQYCPNPEDWPRLYGQVLKQVFQLAAKEGDPDTALSDSIEGLFIFARLDYAKARD